MAYSLARSRLPAPFARVTSMCPHQTRPSVELDTAFAVSQAHPMAGGKKDVGVALTPFSSGAVFIRVLTVTQDKNTMLTKPIYTRSRRYVRPPYTQQGVKDRDCRVTVAALGPYLRFCCFKFLAGSCSAASKVCTFPHSLSSLICFPWSMYAFVNSQRNSSHMPIALRTLSIRASTVHGMGLPSSYHILGLHLVEHCSERRSRWRKHDHCKQLYVAQCTTGAALIHIRS